MHSASVNRCLWCVGGLLYLLHFTVLQSFSLNVPMWDEWDILKPVSEQLDISWLFRLHAEHRIVLTKLQTWLLFRLGGWNLNAHVMMNFLIYAAFSFLLLKVLERKFRLSLGIFLIISCSTLPYANHYYPFQSQFHFFLLFFFLAVVFVLRYDSWNWLGSVFAILSAYSLGSGAICAMLFVALCIMLSYLRPALRFRYLLQAGIISLAIILWLIGYQKPPGHPPLVMPYQLKFWNHYLNVLSLGFGYEAISMLPGIIILLSLISLSILRITTLQEITEKEKADWLGILVIILGLLLSVAAISMARGAFGPMQAKSSRYAEVSGILAPLTWVLFHSAASGITNRTYRNALASVILLFLVAPFYNDFGLRTTYSREFEKKLATQQCIRKYYAGQGDGRCWMTFPDFIGDRLDLARERGVLFSRELN